MIINTKELRKAGEKKGGWKERWIGRKADEKGGACFVDRKSFPLLRQAHRQRYVVLIMSILRTNVLRI
jgi:hypothetical protein